MAQGQKFSNAARAYLASAINSTDTSLTVNGGGDAFPVADLGTAAIGNPGTWFKLTFENRDEFNVPYQEVVICRTHTAGSNTFSNLLRGQEGTVALGFSDGTVVGQRLTAGDAESFGGKEDFITPGTANQYFAGDKTFKTLDKAAVGLDAVDNTADINKPISTQVLAALGDKVDKVTGKQLSTNDFSNTEKAKLAGVALGATANTGTVTSVGMSVPTGLSVSGSPITGSGTLAMTFAAGYEIPTTAKQSQWDTAHGWGNHASAGYAVASSLATVATSGSYNDLSNKPSIPTLPATVAQAEAEAGTATTLRGWTSQRVRQNVAAYTYSKDETNALISDLASTTRDWQATTASLTINASNKVDFSSIRTLSLPSSPTENDFVEILRTAGSTTGSIIDRNGNTIEDLAENVNIDSDIRYLRLDFVNNSWRVAS